MAGERRARRTTGQKVALAVAAVVALGLPAWMIGGSYLRQRDSALSMAGEADIRGAPCPQITRAQFTARGLKAPRATNYEDVIFARQFGHMECRGIRYGGGWSSRIYPVCQFTSPNVLKVTTGEGEWHFHPGPGQPVTVATPNGRATCVMAANFTMENLVAR